MTKTKTNPEMRFAGFTDDWIPSKLGNIGEVKMCKRIFNNQTSPKGDIPFFKIGTFGKKADSYISKELYQEFRTKYPFPKKGDILLSAAGTLGRIVVYDGKPAYFQDSNIVWLNHNESKILNEFLYYIYGNITYESEGGTIQRLYNSIILNARFSFPESKDEQKLIGIFLKNIDNLITEHQQKRSKLKSLKQAMLDKMFPKQGQLVPEIRFKGISGEWKEKKLNEFSTYHSSTLSVGNALNQGKYKLYDVNEVIGFSNENGQPCEYIAIIKDGSGVGRVRLMEQNTSFIGTMGGIRPFESDVNFLYCCLIKSDFNKYITGATIPHIYYSDFGEKNYCIPSINEQQMIGNYFKNIDNIINNLQVQIEKLKNIKKAFLTKMFI